MSNLTKEGSRPLEIPSYLELRIGLVFAVLLFSFVTQFSHAHAASTLPKVTYNCLTDPNASSGHCYSQVEWNGAAGGFTQIFTNQLYSGGGFVTNEMWLGANNGEWVEAGLISTNVPMIQGSGLYNHNSTAEFLFWGDLNDGGLFYFHAGPNLASSDFGKTASVEILKTSIRTYAINIWNLPSASLSSTAGYNTMSDDYIHTGAELYGATSASAPVNGYSSNEWYNPNGGGSWNVQGNTPSSPFVTGPWEGYWAAQPSQDGSGGDWRNCIRGAGC